MKILFIKSTIHHKNLNFILKCKNITFTHINSVEEINYIDLSLFDFIYSPCHPIDVKKYPNSKFIFGPHFSVFPEFFHMNMIKSTNSIYIQPSNWAANSWLINPVCNNINVNVMSFGVDTHKFIEIKPINKREKVFIYFKHRDPNDLLLIQDFLHNKNFEYKIFSYRNGYNEEDYLNYLKEAKFGIWVGGHESQGFALEEALSCNVPLLVWNVKSMNQEYGSNYHDISATSIPYWDERCGEYFYNFNEIENVFNQFITKLEIYKPRDYVLENLSIDICEEKFIHLIRNRSRH